MSKLKLMANLPIYVDKIPIHSPTLKSIAEVEFNQYQLLLTYCVITKECLIDSSKVLKSNYDAFIDTIDSTEGVLEVVLWGLYFFTKIEFEPKILDGDLVFVKENVVLRRNNYDYFVDAIKFVNHIEIEDSDEELDEFDRRIKEAEKKINEALNKNVEQPNFEDLISAVANIDGNGLNIINIWDLNIYQFYEQLHRGQLKETFKWNQKLLLAGAKPDDIKLESYFKNIK